MMIVNSTSKKKNKEKSEKKKQIFCFKLTNRSKNQFQKTIYPIPPIDEQREHFEG